MAQIGVDGIIFGLQPVGGITTYAIEMLRRVAARGDAVLELPKRLNSRRGDEIPADVWTSHVPLPGRLMQFCPSLLDADVILSTYYRTPLRRHSKSLVTVYDFTYERYRKGLPRWVHSTQKRRACRQADAIACISESTRGDLLRAYPEIDPARVYVTLLAADHTRFFPTQTAATYTNKVIFVGQRAGYKRFDLARDAVARAGLELLIVGPPLTVDETGALNKAIPGRWQALGRVDDAVLRDLYANAYALIYPSDYEGFGLPVLEAQACGCPVLTSRSSSLPEVGGTAAIYAPAQTVENYVQALEMLNDPSERPAIIARGLANARAFTWDETWRQTEMLLQNMLDDPSPPLRQRSSRK